MPAQPDAATGNIFMVYAALGPHWPIVISSKAILLQLRKLTKTTSSYLHVSEQPMHAQPDAQTGNILMVYAAVRPHLPIMMYL